MSAIPSADDIEDEAVEEYIDVLHDRIQFLEEELQRSEETVLELHQETAENPLATLIEQSAGGEDSEPGDDFETDVASVARYIRHLTTDYDIDREQLQEIYDTLGDTVDECIDDTSDHHHASMALWLILVQHEEMARG